MESLIEGAASAAGKGPQALEKFLENNAATMQTLTNSRWGDNAIAFPTAVDISTSTVAGAALVFQYNGGATDYTTGSLVISGVLERVA